MDKFKMQIFKDSFKYGRKRKEATKNIAIAVIAILLSTIIASLIAAMFGYDPFETIRVLFSAAIINEPDKFAYMLCVFAMAAFAFSFAFKAGIFNIGISGQMYGAGVVLLVVTTALKDVQFPPFVGQMFSLIIAMSVGALIALLTGAMERYLKVNSVVSAIILNWIILLIGFFIIGWKYSNNLDYSQMTTSTDIPSQFTLAGGEIAGWIPAIIIVVIVAILLLVLTKYTVFGHKIKSTGLSLEGSKYAGYNVDVIKLVTFAISGALSGLLAVILYTAKTPNIPATILNVTVPVEGFNGIAVGLIAGNNPIGIIAVSAIIGLFKTSSSFLPMSPTFNDVIIGLVMLGAALSIIMYKYRPWVYILKKRYASEIVDPHMQYENKLDSVISKYKSIYSVYKREENKTTTVEKILNDYMQEVVSVKREYHESMIHEWMIRRLRPQKYLLLNNDRECAKFDEKLTKYVSKQKSMIASNNEFISKNKSVFGMKMILSRFFNRKERLEYSLLAIIMMNNNIDKDNLQTLFGYSVDKPLEKLIADGYVKYQLVGKKYYYSYNEKSLNAIYISEEETPFNSLLLFSNKNRMKKINKSINQNTVWKEEAINKNNKKFNKHYNIKSNITLNGQNITSYDSSDKKLNMINKEAIRMINSNKSLNVESRNQLLDILADYNNEIIKNGGWLC